MKATCRTVAVLVVIAATMYAIDRWSLAPLVCARAAWHGARTLAPVERRHANARTVSDEVRATLARCDCGTRTDVALTLADAAETSSDPHSAMVLYQRALDVDRRPETYFALGMAACDATERELALDSFMRAGVFDPERVKAIPYDELRAETVRRIQARYGDDWLR